MEHDELDEQLNQLNIEEQLSGDNMDIPLIQIPATLSAPIVEKQSDETAQVSEEQMPEIQMEESQFADLEQPVITLDGEAGGVHPKQNAKRKRIVKLTTVAACLVMLVSLAWYLYISHRSVYTEDREVMVPYYLYLLDENSKDYFQLRVMNMHPEETKQVIFCVSNEDVDEDLSYSVGRNSDFDYELELAYTSNIPLKYTVYSLDKVETYTDENGNEITLSHGMSNMPDDVIETKYEEKDADGQVMQTSYNFWVKHKVTDQIVPLTRTSTSADDTEMYNKEVYGDDYSSRGIVNVGIYDLYKEGADGGTLHLQIQMNQGQDAAYEHHYYMIEVEWDDEKRTITNTVGGSGSGELATFDSYLKETDLVYVIVKAMQPRPVEQN